MPAQHESRRLLLAESLRAADLEVALVTSLVNVRYLTGFTGSSAALAVRGDGSAELVTDSRYTLQVREECPDVPAHISRGGHRFLAERLEGDCSGAAGFEDRSLSVAGFRDLPTSADWRPLGTMVGDLRMVKDAGEIELLRAACRASDAALAEALPRIRTGVTEREVARWIDDGLRDRSEGPGFETIVAAGANGAIPHHQPTDRMLASGDLVTIDFGARVGGYHADMTRTFAVAHSDDWQREIYEVVRLAQAEGVAALAPGREAPDVDAASRKVIEQAGYGKFFGHGLGHGVGLQIHEAPFLGASSADKLKASVPVTVEPGVYLPEQGGVRIEDTVVVHEDHVETLTTTTRDLLVVG
ncbi:MAG: aminopeptidase P family protein [Actinomycetes bacterium]